MSWQASADIRPSRFVKRSGAYTAAECGAGEVMVGVSAEGSNYPPIGSQAELAAANGDPVSIIWVGDGQQDDRPILLTIGGSVTQGDRLKSDSQGRGVAATTNNDVYGAIALQSGSSGESIQVRVLFGYVGA